MSDNLLEKATKAVSDKQNKIAEKDIADYLNSIYNFENKRELAFIIEYIKSGIAYKAYQKIYGEHITNGGAAVLANRILNKVKFRITDYLNLTGNGIESMMEALQTLKTSDPKEYLKYMTKLHGLDVQKTELTGSGGTPIQINIVSDINKVQ